jgi:hypothetical protein
VSRHPLTALPNDLLPVLDVEIRPGAVFERNEIVYAPDLTPAEAAKLDAIQAWLSGPLRADTFAEYLALRQQIAGLRDYLANGAPTGPETVAAVKGTIRLLRALFRELTGG